MIESRYTDAIRKKVIQRIYPLKISMRHVRGVPDSWYSGSKTDLWVEYKYLRTIPIEIDPKKLLSGHQQEWLKRRFLEGRNVAVIIGAQTGGIVLPGAQWRAPISRDEFLQKSLSTNEIADFIADFVGVPNWELLEKNW